MKNKALIFALSCVVIGTSAANAEDTYKRAVLNYQAHHYSAALTDLEKLAAAYPTNAMVRYYRALSYQGTNQMARAKTDFEWVANNCPDAKIKQMGAIGLRNLGSYRSQISGSSAATVATNYTSHATAAPTASANPSGKLQKILEFTLATCPTCINFAPVFAQTKSKYPGLDMQSLDVEDSSNSQLVSQFQVKNYPTIVFLSGSGQVLFKRAGAPDTVAQFSQLIDTYR